MRTILTRRENRCQRPGPERSVTRVFVRVPTGPDGRLGDHRQPLFPGETPVSDKSVRSAQTAKLDAVVSLAKRRGFVFPSGEIYGGTRSAWDYGPLGVELKENIKRQWWRAMVTSRDDIVGLDSSVILPRQVWVASGHVGVFTDPLTECLSCHKR